MQKPLPQKARRPETRLRLVADTTTGPPRFCECLVISLGLRSFRGLSDCTLAGSVFLKCSAWFGRNADEEPPTLKCRNQLMRFGIIMFFGIIALAISVFQGKDAQGVAVQTIAPTFPNGSIITVMSLIGGVGGATGILAYSYWIREKSWRDAEWKPVVRIDLFISYALVFVFAVAMSAVGAFILYGQGFTISDNDSLFAIADSLVSRIGEPGRIVFLISFLAVVYTSVLGGFSGIAYVTADCIRVLRRYPHQDEPKFDMSAKSVEFRGALVYLSIATLAIMSLGQPVTLVLIYAAISAFILPVLAIALLVILNRTSVPAALRNKRVSNVLLTICFLLFGALAVLQVQESVMGLLG